MTVFIGNTNVLDLIGLKDALLGTAIGTASVSVTVKDLGGMAVTGTTWPIAMACIDTTNGNYRGIIPETLVLTPGYPYRAVVDVDAGVGGSGTTNTRSSRWSETHLIPLQAKPRPSPPHSPAIARGFFMTIHAHHHPRRSAAVRAACHDGHRRRDPVQGRRRLPEMEDQHAGPACRCSWRSHASRARDSRGCSRTWTIPRPALSGLAIPLP